MIRRVTTIVLAGVIMMTVASSSALAANVHLKKGSLQFTDNGLTLSATGALAGLGNEDIQVILTATGDVSATCSNPAGHQAPGQNPADVTLTGVQNIPSTSIKNGNVRFDVTTGAPEQPTWDEAGCPNRRWTAEITDVDFTSATLTVIQDGETVLERTSTNV